MTTLKTVPSHLHMLTHSPTTSHRLIETGLELLRDPAFKDIEMVHQITKQIVNAAVTDPKCADLNRFFNLKGEIINNATLTLGKRLSAEGAELQRLSAV